MALRYDLPRVPSHTSPSFWNHEMAKWALLGNTGVSIVSSLVLGTALFSGVGALIALGGTWIGAQYGAKIGMQEQARELVEGRVVSDPTYWNKGIVTGLAIGAVANIFLPAGIGIGLLTAIAGSVMRKQALQQDFDQAVAAQEYAGGGQRGRAPMAGIAPTIVQYKNTVSPEEAQALAEKQQASPQPHAAALEAAQEQAASTQPQRG